MVELDRGKDYVSANFAGSARWMAPEVMMYKVRWAHVLMGTSVAQLLQVPVATLLTNINRR